MKVYIPEFNANDLKGVTESFFIIPFLKDAHYEQLNKTIPIHNEGIFASLFFNPPENIKITNLENCDYVVMPYKFNPQSNINDICEKAKTCNKQVIAFYNDDDSQSYNLPENLILFRTSTTSTTIQKQERIFPVITPDHTPSNLKLTDELENKFIGFTGHAVGERQLIVEGFKQSYPFCNFIIREGHWAPGVPRLQARREFYKNLLENQFTLCMRGRGNFSYRFYEALCFGRIPILIDTDIVLPFQNSIDWNKHIIKINSMEISKIGSIIENSKYSPSDNRKLWCEYFSPEGYIQKIHLEL